MVQTTFIGKFNPINYSYCSTGQTNEVLSNSINRQILEKLNSYISSEKFSNSSLSDKLENLENIVFEVLGNVSDHLNLIPGDTRFPANFISLKHHCSFVAGISSLLSMIILEQYFLEKASNKTEAENLLKEKHIMDFDISEIPEFAKLIQTIYESKENELDISPKEFILINRIAGLLHDIAKPDLHDHANKSANRAEYYLNTLKIDQKIVNIIKDAISHHHPSSSLIDKLPQGIVTAADYIATSERSALFNPDFYELVLNEIDNENWELKTLFDQKDITNIKDCIKDKNYNQLKNINVVSRKMYQEKNYFKFFTLSKDSVEKSIIYEIFKKLQDNLNNKLNLQLDLARGKYLSFFYGEFKSIQSFIFRSQKLKVIENSSILVQYINKLMEQEFINKMGRSLVVSSGGGNFIGICSINQIDSLKKLVCTAIESDANLADIKGDILKRLYFKPFKPYEFKYAFPEIFYGLESTGYDFEQIFRSIDFTKPYEQQDEKTRDMLAYYDVSDKEYEIYKGKWNDSREKDKILFDLCVKFVQKKGFGELVSYFFDMPEYKTFDNLSEEYLSDLNSRCQKRRADQHLCELCNSDLAVTSIKEIDGKTLKVCNLCSKLNIRGGNSQEKFNIDSDLVSFKEEFKEELEKALGYKIEFPIDLEHTISDTNPKSAIKDPAMNNMAMITMDGNNIGVMKSRLNMLSLYQEFSELLDKEVKKHLKDSIVSVIKNIHAENRKNRQFNIIPVVPLILGGDDITILVRADLAFPIIKEFFKRIEENLFGNPIVMTRKNNRLELHRTDSGLSETKSNDKKIYLYRFNQDSDLVLIKSNPENYNQDTFKASFYPTGFGAGVFITDPKSPIGRVFFIANKLESKSKILCKKVLRNLQDNDDTAILGGAWNTVAFHYTTTHDLSETYLEKYYSDDYGATIKKDKSSDKLNYAYKICQFPLFSFELNDFISQVSEFAEFIENNQISLNELKGLIRTVHTKTPNENRLLIYYKLGRLNQNEEKSRIYKLILNLLIEKTQRSISHGKENPKTIYLVTLYDFVHYLQFIKYRFINGGH